MNPVLGVCVVALIFAGSSTPAPAQSAVFKETWFGTRRPAQTMRKGISVVLPVTNNAIAMPEADEEDALIVSVTDDGRTYFGIDPTSAAALAERVKHDLASRAERRLYIKADARAPYADVLRVLEALHTAGAEAPNLLTAQREAPARGTIVPPKGLPVLVGRPVPEEERTVAQVRMSGQGSPGLKINNQDVPWADLERTLRQVLQKRKKTAVLVRAEPMVPLADVVAVADACRAADTEVVLFIGK